MASGSSYNLVTLIKLPEMSPIITDINGMPKLETIETIQPIIISKTSKQSAKLH